MSFTGDFKATILADSLHPGEGPRLVTMELEYPRCIHPEFMTHRMFSRNAASSRAIPIETMMQNVQDKPFIPLVWGLNQSGMQAGDEHRNPSHCEDAWLSARDSSLLAATQLNNRRLHKQIVNRVLEPWMWITVIASGIAPAWENFFKLRCHPDAEPHIQKIAYMAREIYDSPDPHVQSKLNYISRDNSCHMPLTGFHGDEHLSQGELKMLSTARCARVSYRTHDGKRDIAADLKLHARLESSGHWSPFGHVATPINSITNPGTSNFGPHWLQYRKEFPNEMCERAPRNNDHE